MELDKTIRRVLAWRSSAIGSSEPVESGAGSGMAKPWASKRVICTVEEDHRASAPHSLETTECKLVVLAAVKRLSVLVRS